MQFGSILSEAARASELPAEAGAGWCELTGGACCCTGNEAAEACDIAAACGDGTGAAGADDTPGVEAVGVSMPAGQHRSWFSTRIESGERLCLLFVMFETARACM